MKAKINRAIIILILLGCLTACRNEEQTSLDGIRQEQTISDGTYWIEAALEGGSGRASVKTPAKLVIRDSRMYVQLEWSSSHYTWMKIDGTSYEPTNTEGNSIFLIPVETLDRQMEFIAQTNAMSTPHEIEYTLTFCRDSLKTEAEYLEYLASEEKASGESNHKNQEDDQSTVTESLEEVSQFLGKGEPLNLEYAREFTVERYERGFQLITIHERDRYLVVPEHEKAPEEIPTDVTILQLPLRNLYLAASSAGDMFLSLDALDSLSYSALSADSWYLDGMKQAMKENQISYAGKYSEPDYEQILSGGCDLAVENTMIYHSPKVKERLEEFHIPVLVDYSSYETEPLGRVEWVKLYGSLTQKEAAAEALFSTQKELFDQVREERPLNKKVAFFYISSNGEINIRRANDYLPKMIGLAGGTYFWDQEEKTDSAVSTMSIQMETFYAAAKDADILIYNSTIDGELSSIEALLAKQPILKNCKAVRNGAVYCTRKKMHQSSMAVGEIMQDLHRIFIETEDADLKYLYRLN